MMDRSSGGTSIRNSGGGASSSAAGWRWPRLDAGSSAQIDGDDWRVKGRLDKVKSRRGNPGGLRPGTQWPPGGRG